MPNVRVLSREIQIGSCSCCSQTFRTQEATDDLFGPDYAIDYPDELISQATIDEARAALLDSLANLDAIELALKVNA